MENKLVHRYKRPEYRKATATPMKEAFMAMIKSMSLEDRFHQERVKHNWAEVLGAQIAQRTEQVFFKGKTLYIKLNSAPLKQELQLNKPRIVARVCEYAGQAIVTDVVLL